LTITLGIATLLVREMFAPSPHGRKRANALTEAAGFDVTERRPRAAAGGANALGALV
jgi:hypothetical protein